MMKLNVMLAALALMPGAALAQTVEQTVATIFYAADGGGSPNVTLHKVSDCTFRVDMYGKPAWEVDFSQLVRAEITKTSPKTEVTLVGASALFASIGSGRTPLRNMSVVQNAGTGDSILKAVEHLRKNYCPGKPG